jgi:AGZA family xanthine/uracil permease-like MFS transporter
MQSGTEPSRLPWIVRGDLDGFFGLAVDNLVQFLLVLDLLVLHVGIDPTFVVSRILPGAAASLVVGNLYYAWQARRLAARTGRRDVTALPYGINTVSLFAFVLFIMAPTYQELAADPTVGPERAATIAWQVGLVACLLSGVIEALGGFVGGWVRRVTPRAALLSTLAGIAVGFISMDFLVRSFDKPLVAIVALGILLLSYLGRVRFPGGLPGGLVAVGVGTAVAWLLHGTGYANAPVVGVEGTGGSLGLHLPRPAVADLWDALGSPHVWGRLSIIVPMGLLNVLGSLQNVESAEAEGDAFPTAASLAVNGAGSIVAAGLGSCFPTTIYIGHPGWKRMGARWGYSVLNAAFFAVVAGTGAMAAIARIVPLEAAMAIMVWIAVVITAQAFTATPREHAPAVFLGLLPGLAAWGWLMVEMTQLGLKVSGELGFDRTLPELVDGLRAGALPFVGGLLTLRAGFLFSGMILAAIGVFLIQRRLLRAALWALLAAGLSLLGVMHSYSLTETAVRDEMRPGFAWEMAAAYLAASLVFALGWLASRGSSEGTVK